jgi:isopenicillin-N epimerase
MAPKGSAFLYARREIQQRLMPLIVSWGYESLHPSHSQFIDYHEWQGTRDMAAFLAVPAAIEFQKKHNWDKVRQECQRLAIETRLLVNSLTGYDPICPDPVIAEGASHRWFCQMFAVELPTHLNPELFKLQLYEKYRIEAPVICWNDRRFIRVSIQGYNSRSDVDALIEALKQILPSNR